MSSSGKTALCTALDQIGIVPAQLYGAPPRDFLREDISMGLSIGENTVERPVKLESPLIIGGVQEAYFKLDYRQALIYGSGFTKTLVDMGWLGILEEEREFAASIGARTMLQMTPARLGADVSSIKNCDALTLSLLHSGSGSASGSMGSVIIPDQIAPELLEHLGLGDHGPLLSPPRLLDMDTPRDLNKIIQLIREVTNFEIPILIKIGPGRVYNDIRIAVKAKVDAVVLDCGEHAANSTNAPGILPNSYLSSGLPLIGVLAPTQSALKNSNAKDEGVKFIFEGDLLTGADIFKVMAFGADGVLLGTGPAAAAGMLAEPETDNPGKVKGAKTTQRFEPKKAGLRIAEHLNTVYTELKSLTAWTGHDSIESISQEDLRALNFDTASVTGLKLMGYDKILTMWEH
jgi:glutamate synthase domain-containing protein 2